MSHTSLHAAGPSEGTHNVNQGTVRIAARLWMVLWASSMAVLPGIAWLISVAVPMLTLPDAIGSTRLVYSAYLLGVPAAFLLIVVGGRLATGQAWPTRPALFAAAGMGCAVLAACLLASRAGILDGYTLAEEYSGLMAGVVALAVGIALLASLPIGDSGVLMPVAAAGAVLAFLFSTWHPVRWVEAIAWVMSAFDLPLLAACIVATSGVACAFAAQRFGLGRAQSGSPVQDPAE